MSPYVASAELESGINIITYQPTGFTVDPNSAQGQRVRRLIFRIKELGIQTLILNFRGVMYTGTTNEVSSVVPENLWREEENRVLELADYAKGLGLQVAFRPILLVVGPNGEFPYQENGFYWWHGVIRPSDPQSWFNSYFNFHARYMILAQKCQAAWYSVGAEMHSMTSGLGSRDPSRKLGYPDLWVEMIEKARPLLGNTKITYGANYTDQYVLEEGRRTWGGELEQWRYYLTQNMNSPEEVEHQNNLRRLWQSLDFIGIDFYRSLGDEHTNYPADFTPLANLLDDATQSLSSDLSLVLQEIDSTMGLSKKLFIQEIGYRSVEKSFVKPYLYEGDNIPINYIHQAAAWEAILRSFWKPTTPMISGIGIWQVLLDDDTDMIVNGGFSPLGKEPSENVLKKYFIKEPVRRR
jgi:hypothetical protein